MIIKNSIYQELNDLDLLVCVLGYEPRSWFLLSQNINTRNSKNTLIFNLYKSKQVYALSKKTKKQVEDIFDQISIRNLKLIDCDYKDGDKIRSEISEFFKNKSKISDKGRLNIDYSSMPRNWYCTLPVLMKNLVNTMEVVYWYIPGEYPARYKNFPSAGIDSISVFSGITLPAVDVKRYHFMGLGYDNIRTETAKSIIEPEAIIACYAYDPSNNQTKKNIYELNKNIIDNAFLSVSLPINNFSGMVDRLCELTYNQLREGQVIIIPDGPKPLIMAMSLIPDLIKKDGLTCLHISRNTKYHSEIQVLPKRNEIFGFHVRF